MGMILLTLFRIRSFVKGNSLEVKIFAGIIILLVITLGGQINGFQPDGTRPQSEGRYFSP